MPRKLVVVLALGIALAALLVWFFLGEGGGPWGWEAGNVGDEAAEEHDSRSASGDAEGSDREVGRARGGASLFGRPRAEQVGRGGIRGRVAESEEARGIEGAGVMLVGVGFGGEEVEENTKTKADGTFAIPDVPAGDAYDLRIQADGLPDRVVPGIAVRDGNVTDLGDLWMGTAALFEGEVVDSRGQGIAGALVQLHAGHVEWSDLVGRVMDLFTELDREPEPLAETRTAADGRFRFEQAAPGPVTLVVRARGHAPGHLATVVTPPDDSGRRVRIRLDDGVTVSGRVVDASGRGVPGARVAATGGDDPSAFVFGRTITDTGTDGSFWIHTALRGTRVQLVTTYPGHPVTMTTVEGGAENVVIVLDGGAVLALRIVAGPEDTPVEGARILVSVGEIKGSRSRGTQILGTGVTDPTGRAEFILRPGAIEIVMVTHPERGSGVWSSKFGGMGGVRGLMQGPEDGMLKQGRREIALKYGDMVRLEGTVTDADSGAPIAGARVAGIGGFGANRPTLSDEAGRYAMSVPAAERAVVIVRAPGYVQGGEFVSVALGEAVDGVLTHDVAVERGAVVSGRVVDERGRPVAGARIRAEVSQGDRVGRFGREMFAPNTAVSGRSGAFMLDGVPRQDDVRLVARRTGFVDGACEPFSTKGGGAVRGRRVVLEDGHRVEILVLDPTGLEVAGAKVKLLFEREDGVRFDPPSFGGHVTLRTDREGVARKERVPTCTLGVTASHPSWTSTDTTHVVSEDAASPVRLRVELRRARTLRGRVVDEGGKAVAGANLWMYADGTTRSASSDADGRFELQGVPEDEVSIQVRAKGYRAQRVPAAPQGNELEIRLVVEDAPKDVALPK